MFHLLAKHARYVGEATVSGRLFDLGEYPGMIPSDDRSKVVGELYEIDPAKWHDVVSRLDKYEGCSSDDEEPHEYRRELVSARSASGVVVPAWAYVLNGWPDTDQEIKSGDYLSWRAAHLPNGTSGVTSR
jgi:gamma-glutamylcyclotransferase (GGCT)/AIG2-like uncharacterized protein YtfP